jgi:hypothetical protein
MSNIVIEGKNLKDIDQSNFQSVGSYTNINQTQVKEQWQGRYKSSTCCALADGYNIHY